MAPTKVSEGDLLVERIRSIQRSNQANKRCADCLERGPTYVCLDFQTFVCQLCSGIHREFHHKIKSISLSEWNPAEVALIEAGGNEKAAVKWLDRWNKEQFPEPDSSDVEAVREFIRLKYAEKKWFRPHGRSGAEAPAEAAAGYAAAKAPAAPSAPFTPAPAASNTAAPQIAPMLDLLSGGASPPAKPRVPAADASPLLGGLDFSPVAGEAASAPGSWTADFAKFPAAEVAKPASKNSSFADGLIDLDFSCPTPKAAPPLAKELNFDLVDPVAEPAEEPAPTPAGQTSQDDSNISLGEKLREAVLSGNADDLQRLFKQCAESPPKKANSVDASRLAAYSAFDDLCGDGAAKVEAVPGVPAVSSTAEIAATSQAAGLQQSLKQPTPQKPKPEDALAGLEGLLTLGAGKVQRKRNEDGGPQCFFIGEDDDPPLTVLDPIAAVFATSSSSQPPSPGALSRQQLSQLMPSGLAGNLTPQQLEQMNPKELVQLQLMISQALQGRALPPAPSSRAPVVNTPSPAPWQAQRQASGAKDVDWTPSEPQAAAPFGDLLDAFNGMGKKS